MKPFLFLLPKFELFCLSALRLKKDTNKKNQTNLRLLVHFGKNRKQNSEKRKGKMKEVAKGESRGLSAGNGKGTTCSQRGLPANQHCSPLSLSFSFSFSPKALFELQHTKEKKQLSRWKHDLPKTDSSEKVYEMRFKISMSHTALKHLTTTLGAKVGFCASAGFFMSAGLLGLGDMVEGLGPAAASPLPSATWSRGTPAIS